MGGLVIPVPALISGSSLCFLCATATAISSALGSVKGVERGLGAFKAVGTPVLVPLKLVTFKEALLPLDALPAKAV